MHWLFRFCLLTSFSIIQFSAAAQAPNSEDPRMLFAERRVGRQIAINWSPVAGVAEYQVQVARDSNFQNAARILNLRRDAVASWFLNANPETSYWFRVRAKLESGLGPWSDPIQSAPNGTSPMGSIGHTNGEIFASKPWITLNLTATDPGPSSSGVKFMRFRFNGGRWQAWEEFKLQRKILLDRGPGPVYVDVQFKDRAGHGSAPYPVKININRPMAFVDLANSAGPWDGSAQHPFKSIQQAIDAVTTGTEIVIAQGRYLENLYLNRKDVILRSSEPDNPAVVAATIIDGHGAKSTIRFDGKETEQCVIDGLNITGGNSISGAGVDGNNCKATFLNSMIIDNLALQVTRIETGDGNAFYTYHGLGGGMSHVRGMVVNCIFAYNSAWQTGGAGIELNGQLINCVFFNNLAGGLPDHLTRSNSIIQNCFFSDGKLENSIVAEGSIYNRPDLNPYNNTVGDFHLKQDAPVIDRGIVPDFVFPDYDGDPRGLRSTHQLPQGGTDFDIGVDEYVPDLFIDVLGSLTIAPDQQLLPIRWFSKLEVSGTAVHIDLIPPTGEPVRLGTFWNPDGEEERTLTLPALTPGATYKLQVISSYVPSLKSESQPIQVQTAAEAAGSAVLTEDWVLYQ